MQHPDPRAAVGLDDVLARQGFLQRRLVHVPLDPLHRRPKRPQLLKERDGDEIPAVQDQVRAAQQPDALVRQRPRPAREVCIGDDRDPRSDGRYTRTSLPTRNVFEKVVTRSGFVWALTRTSTR